MVDVYLYFASDSGAGAELWVSQGVKDYFEGPDLTVKERNQLNKKIKDFFPQGTITMKTLEVLKSEGDGVFALKRLQKKLRVGCFTDGQDVIAIEYEFKKDGTNTKLLKKMYKRVSLVKKESRWVKQKD